MTELHQTEVDGVRCFWVDTGRPTLAARLTFRYGAIDEPITESGWQHLLEHLALVGRGGGALHVNGSISLLHTAFDAHGPADLVATHLEELTRWLSAPSLEGLSHEAKVLRAEALHRGDSVVAEALGWRYGAAGPGLVPYHDPAIGRATPDQLAARAAATLTRGNAVLALDGPPPAGLRLHLPSGAPVPTPAARPLDDPLPAAYVEPRGLVVSGVVERSAPMNLGHDLLRQAFEDELRTGAGAAYAPWSTYEPVDDDHAVVFGGSDVGADLMPVIVARTLQLVRKLRSFAPDESDLEKLKAARVQLLQDPFTAMALAVTSANEVLSGRPPRELEEWVQTFREVTARQVRDAFEAFHSTMLLGVPGSAAWDDPMPMLRPRGHPLLREARRWRSHNWPADQTRLLVGESGVALRHGKEERTVPASTVTAMMTFEDGLRHVIQRDGFGLWVDPREWHGGHAAVATLDRVVPAELHLPVPAIERPAPERATFVRRWIWRPAHTTGRGGRVAVVLLMAAAAFTGALVVGQPSLVGAIGVATFFALRSARED